MKPFPWHRAELKRLTRATEKYQPAVAPAGSDAVRRSRWRTGALIGAVATAVIARVAFKYAPRTPALGREDEIIVADFANSTGDAVFDETLKQALTVQLRQSPYLNVVSDDRVRETLRFMGRSPEAIR